MKFFLPLRMIPEDSISSEVFEERKINKVPVALVEQCGEQTWMMVVDPISDIEKIFAVHRGLTASLFLKETRNPHLSDMVDKGLYPSAITLGSKWLEAVFSKTEPLLINRLGGWQYVRGAKIVRKEESSVFPIPHEIATEIFTITKYIEGSHYYVESTNRISPDKFNNKDDAISWCKTQNSIAKIQEKVGGYGN